MWLTRYPQRSPVTGCLFPLTKEQPCRHWKSCIIWETYFPIKQSGYGKKCNVTAFNILCKSCEKFSSVPCITVLSCWARIYNSGFSLPVNSANCSGGNTSFLPSKPLRSFPQEKRNAPHRHSLFMPGGSGRPHNYKQSSLNMPMQCQVLAGWPLGKKPLQTKFGARKPYSNNFLTKLCINSFTRFEPHKN